MGEIDVGPEKERELEDKEKVSEKVIGFENETEDGALVEEQGLGTVSSSPPAAPIAPLSPKPRAEGSGEEVPPLSTSHPPIGASPPQGHEGHGRAIHDDPLRGEDLTDALNSLTVADPRSTTPNPPASRKGTGVRSPIFTRSKSMVVPGSEGDTNPSAEGAPSMPSATSSSSPPTESPAHV